MPKRRLKKRVKIALYGLTMVGIGLLLGMRAQLIQSKQLTTEPIEQQVKPATKLAQKPPSKAAIKRDLLAKWRRVIATDSDIPVSIAVYSKQYDLTVAYNNHKSTSHTTASIVKVAMLSQVLHQHAQTKTTLTSSERATATGAIENSNNADATALYHAGGSATGLNQLFAALDMQSSQAYASGWVATTTTASDQLKLLNQVFYETDYLTANSKAYIKELMANVEADQQWGVSAGTDTFELKNGWRLQNGAWIVNSIGHLGQGNHSCTLAILTDRHTSLKSGIKFVEKLAKATGTSLNLK